MEEFKNYAKANIEKSIQNVYNKNKESNKGTILIRTLQGLKYCTNKLEDERLSKEELFELTDFIINISKVVENFDELQPTLKKYFNAKADMEKWNNSDKNVKYIEEVEN